MKLSKEEIDEVMAEAKMLKASTSNMREGQCFFICLYRKFPEIASEIIKTDFDPFHDSGKLNECINHLTK